MVGVVYKWPTRSTLNYHSGKPSIKLLSSTIRGRQVSDRRRSLIQAEQPLRQTDQFSPHGRRQTKTSFVAQKCEATDMQRILNYVSDSGHAEQAFGVIITTSKGTVPRDDVASPSSNLNKHKVVFFQRKCKENVQCTLRYTGKCV